jgi:H+-transporting ATPase
MYPIQHHPYREGIKNLSVLLIGGIPIAMLTVLSIAMTIGSHQLSQHVLHFIPLGFVTQLPTYRCHSIKLMHVYGQGHLSLIDSKVGVVQVIMKLFDLVSLLATTTSRVENQDVINATIVGILADPKEVKGRPLVVFVGKCIIKVHVCLMICMHMQT